MTPLPFFMAVECYLLEVCKKIKKLIKLKKQKKTEKIKPSKKID